MAVELRRRDKIALAELDRRAREGAWKVEKRVNPNRTDGQGGYFAVPPNASGVAQRATVENYKRGFAPRMGLAYRINEKLVFRGDSASVAAPAPAIAETNGVLP